ncbi:PH-interacting protein [Nymphon striatum]|nr:PH-interacting protein [Nymphon striatum]
MVDTVKCTEVAAEAAISAALKYAPDRRGGGGRIEMSQQTSKPKETGLLESELYFLICKFLSNGPCTAAAAALLSEIERYELLPKRLDWQGNEHPTNLRDFTNKHPHITNDYLKRICKSIGPLLEKEHNSNVKGVQSLLGAGHHSLLRTSKDLQTPKYNLRVNNHKLYLKPSAAAVSSGSYPANLEYEIRARWIWGAAGTLSISSSYLRTKGSDDNLIKIWSANSSLILGTLRGHSAEITDMDINIENTLLASGSCDKVIRIWCLKTTACVMVLTGHSGHINSLKFCPWVKSDIRYLASVGNDGNVMFWEYNNKTYHFNKVPRIFLERAKSGAKMMCSAFSKGNFLFVDEIQSFHWENKQATLHPFVAYRKLEDGTLEHRNICVVSDVKEHSTSTVYAFQQVVLDYLKNEFPEIKKVHYFTDGCAGQYKNKHNFINLCCHQKDFGLEAEWNFFATSHGKSACDGIGGTVKRLLTKASLQRPYSDPILTIEAIMEFCVEKISGIKFFNVPPEDVKKFNTDLRNRFEISTTIKGTHQFHRFVPLSPTHLSVYKLSAQVDLPVVVAITALAEHDNISEVPLDIAEQNYVCCLYDNEPWIGLVEDISDEHGDYHIKFMHPHGPAKLFRWPRDEDRCWIDKKSILCVIDTPSLAISTRMYNISKHDTAKITGLCGVFLATGSADHHVRLFHVGGTDFPQKIFDIEAHLDRVDSLQFSNNDYRFVSGSKDGTAKIWSYEMQNWRSITLQANIKSEECTSEKSAQKSQVTMVGWSLDDQYVITAVSVSFRLRVWASQTGQLVHTFKGHEDEVYVVEAHPHDPKIIMSAGHDGKVILWDLHSKTCVKIFNNAIDGQGNGHVFDGRFSPIGLSIVITDSHGHYSILGMDSNEPYKKVPKEQFYHTDYRPLTEDANHYVVDEQTQLSPHLMPIPFLVDIDGNPYPPAIQRLVPGREQCKDNQLIPHIAVSADGDTEVLQPIRPHDSDEQHANQDGDPNIDVMIEILEAQNRQPGEVNDGGPMSPSLNVGNRRNGNGGPSPSRAGLRREGNIEGVRQAETIHGNWQSMGVQGERQSFTKHHCVVKRLSPSVLEHKINRIIAKGEAELEHYCIQKKKKHPPVQENADEKLNRFLRRQKSKSHNYNVRSREARAGNYSQSNRTRINGITSFGRVTRRTHFIMQEYENPDNVNISSDGTAAEGPWTSSSEGSSTTDSDWEQDNQTRRPQREQPRGQPEEQEKESDKAKRRSRRRPQQREVNDKSANSDDSSDEEIERKELDEKKKPVISTPPKNILPKKPKRTSASKKANIQSQLPNDLTEVPDKFKPPEWLTHCVPKKTPYQPQVGDELMYFPQGHKCYFEAVQRLKKYDINIKHQPWVKMNLREQEVVSLVGVRYEVKPPRLCCLKLAILDPATKARTGDPFTIKYHDMQDVIDFLILRKYYDIAINRYWKPRDNFRSIIDDAWWIGTIESQEPFQEEYPDSMFQCFNVKWDNGEKEKMSPWDLEIIDETRMPEHRGGGVHVLPSELAAILYEPESDEWPPCGRNVECDRLARGLELIMELGIAEPFNAPVDLNAYPMYAMVVEYPMDLSTIKSRIENHYYRRRKALLFDVKYVEIDANLFNEPGTAIVKKAKMAVELCKRFINDPDCEDPMPLYHELSEEFHLRDTKDVNETITDSNTDDDSIIQGGHYLRGRGNKSSMRSDERRQSRIISSKSWINQCQNLLTLLFDCEDSTPFRLPVDPSDYKDYCAVVNNPMDLSKVREKLDSGRYDDPPHFCKEVRLVIENSKSYNTNKKSRIYSMTIRLSATFEDHFRDILSSWKSAVRREQRSKMLRDESMSSEEVISNRKRPSRSVTKKNISMKSFQNEMGKARHKNSDISEASKSSGSKGINATKASTSSEDSTTFSKHNGYHETRSNKVPLVKCSDSFSSKSSSEMDDSSYSDEGEIKDIKTIEKSSSSQSASSSKSSQGNSSKKKEKVAVKSEDDALSYSDNEVNNHIDDSIFSEEILTKSVKQKKVITDSMENMPHKTSVTSSASSKTSKKNSDSESDDTKSSSESLNNEESSNKKLQPGDVSSDLDSKSSSSKSSSKSSSSSDLDTEISEKPVPKSRSTRQNPSISLRTKRNQRANNTNHRKSVKRKFSDSDDNLSQITKVPKKRMATRNRGKRTVVYQEDSDYEYYGRRQSNSSDDDSNTTSSQPVTSISSRGRRTHVKLYSSSAEPATHSEMVNRLVYKFHSCEMYFNMIKWDWLSCFLGKAVPFCAETFLPTISSNPLQG